MTFAMCWGFLISWMPYAVVSMWTAYGDPAMLPKRITVMAVLTAKSSTVVNPVIYVLMSRKFRPMLSQVFRNLYKNNSSESNSVQGSPQVSLKRSNKFEQCIEDCSSSNSEPSSARTTIRISSGSSSSSKESQV